MHFKKKTQNTVSRNIDPQNQADLDEISLFLRIAFERFTAATLLPHLEPGPGNGLKCWDWLCFM